MHLGGVYCRDNIVPGIPATKGARGYAVYRERIEFLAKTVAPELCREYAERPSQAVLFEPVAAAPVPIPVPVPVPAPVAPVAPRMKFRVQWTPINPPPEEMGRIEFEAIPTRELAETDYNPVETQAILGKRELIEAVMRPVEKHRVDVVRGVARSTTGGITLRGQADIDRAIRLAKMKAAKAARKARAAAEAEAEATAALHLLLDAAMSLEGQA